MLKRQHWMLRVRHLAAIALAVTASLLLRSGWAQQQPPAPVDHSQHAPGQHALEHAGHGDHPPARSTPKAKSKTPGKKEAPAGHKKHGGHTPAPKPGSSGAGHTGHGVPAHPADHHPAEHAM